MPPRDTTLRTSFTASQGFLSPARAVRRAWSGATGPRRTLVAWALLSCALLAPAASAMAPCARPDRLELDLTSWRRKVLAAGTSREALTRVLEAAGFSLDALQCGDRGRVVAVDVLRATFGAKAQADRILQVRTRGCLIERDLVVLTAHAKGTWCRVRGQPETGSSVDGCRFDPPVLALVNLTDRSRHTLRIRSSRGEATATDSGERLCTQQRLLTFWDVEGRELVSRLQVPEGPVLMHGSFPRTVRTPDETGRPRTYRFDGQAYRPEG